jgi:hypothetical protein
MNEEAHLSGGLFLFAFFFFFFFFGFRSGGVFSAG